jgi:predicted enzyme related to lactoylglutathione lyase
MQPLDFQGVKMRLFPLDDPMNGIGGSIIDTGGFHKPSSTEGPLIYLNGNPDVQITLDRVEAAGGKIIIPKKAISEEFGFMALFMDTEGNRIALHSVPEKYLQQ